MLYTGMSLDDRRDLAGVALDRVGLTDRASHEATKLSGGERQRVAIARALIGNPRIVLADEPTGNLDSKTGADIVGLLEQLNEEGTTIVVITHDRDIAGHFPRQIALLDGEVESVYRDHALGGEGGAEFAAQPAGLDDRHAERVGGSHDSCQPRAKAVESTLS